jgi:hypothetical protein
VVRQPSQDRTRTRAAADDESLDIESSGRSVDIDALWAEVRVDPVEIALPSGVGYTLRAYRLSTELTAPEIEREDDFPEWPTGRVDVVEPDEDVVPPIDEEELTAQALAAGERRLRARADADLEGDADDDDPTELSAGAGRSRAADEPADDGGLPDDELDADEADEADEYDTADEADEYDTEVTETTEPEEVPAFLAHRGRLLLFRTPEELVDFVRSDAPHELTQLDTWQTVRDRVTPEAVVPVYEDRYSLDLIVSNLRGGPDAWDTGLILQSGEIARDIAYALRLDSVIALLAPGLPLDDLDETLRSVEQGGIGGLFARRRARRRNADAAAIGWRTVIGKISAAVDWRE